MSGLYRHTLPASIPLNTFRGIWSRRITAATSSSAVSATLRISSTDMFFASSSAGRYSLLCGSKCADAPKFGPSGEGDVPTVTINLVRLTKPTHHDGFRDG